MKRLQNARLSIEIVIAYNEERIVWQSGAISSYTLQSFMPNSGIKGFPFLSGLVALVEQIAIFFNLKKVWAKKKLQKKHPFTVSPKIAELKGISFGKNIKIDRN